VRIARARGPADTRHFSSHTRPVCLLRLAARSALHSGVQIGPRKSRAVAGDGRVGDDRLGFRQGCRRPHRGEFGGRLQRLLERGVDFAVDRCQHGWGVLLAGTQSLENSLRALRDGGIILALGILAHRVRQADFAESIRRGSDRKA